MFVEYPFRDHFVEIDGYRLHYVDEGEGDVIVMVHGNPTWSYYFRHLVHQLSVRYRVIVPDHMGCGLSDKPQGYPYCLSQHIANLEVLLDSLGVARCSLVVHDWGGAIGMGYAVARPDNIEKIVVTNSAAFRSSRIPLRIRLCRWPFIGRFLVRGLNVFSRGAVIMAVSRKMAKEVARAYVAPYDSWQNRVAVSAFIEDIPLCPKDKSYQKLVEIEQGLEELRQRKIPLLIVWGGKDFCFTRHFYDQWRKRFPEAQGVYFEDGGHYLLEDKKDAISPLLTEFFAGSLE